MKKFLKLFSVFALIFCCVFSFAGCNIFREKENTEYAGLVADRKVVREVVNNTKAILQSNMSQDLEPTPSSNDVNARNGFDGHIVLDSCVEELSIYISIIDVIINGSDFVPGKLYNWEYKYTMESEECTDYYLINAYCGEGNMITLNVAAITNSIDNKMFANDSFMNVYDIYYNNEYNPTRFVHYYKSYLSEYTNGADFEVTRIDDVTFSTNGKAEEYYAAEMQETDNQGAVETLKYIINVGSDGVGSMIVEADFTEEMHTTFDENMEEINERTSLYNFARPLSKEVSDKLLEIDK